jgi:hypothetical protein
VIKSVAGRRLDAVIHRLFPFLFVWKLNPNALTLFGALISLLSAVAFARGEFRWAGALMLFGGFFDLVDGVVARHQGTSSRRCSRGSAFTTPRRASPATWPWPEPRWW